MLQRIQTIYMAIVFAISITCLYLATPLLAQLFFGITAMAVFINMYLYHDRKLQFTINRGAIILNLIIIGVYIYNFFTTNTIDNSTKKILTLIAPAVSIFLLFLANKNIHKDEELVRSSDRIR